MEVVMKPIKVYGIWDEEGKIKPLAFCLENDDGKLKFALNVEGRQEQRIAGNRAIDFFCNCEVGGLFSPVVLRYNLRNCCWFLYKM